MMKQNRDSDRQHSLNKMPLKRCTHRSSSSRVASRVALLHVAALIVANMSGTSAFQLSTQRNTRIHNQKSNLMAFNPSGVASSSIDPNFSSLSISPPKPLAAGLTAGSVIVSALLMDNPVLEAHVLTDIAHIGMDLSVFMGKGDLSLQVAAVIGRLCSMAADYVPDHAIVPEEFVFQVAMLLFSCWGLLRAAFLPSLAAILSNIKIRDGRAFRALFAPTGLTWNQYKAMAAVGAIDWVSLTHGESVLLNEGNGTNQDSDRVYWLYDGKMELQSHQANAASHHELPPKLVIARSARETANAPAALLAEHRLLANHTQQHHKIPTEAHVTSETAIFLRLNVSRLERFIINNDPTVDEAMRVLLLQGLDAKLEAHWSRMAQLLRPQQNC